MNKEANFSRFIGIGIVLICIIISVLAFGMAVIRNQNANNIVYIEDSSETMFDLPKSNVVTESVNTEKNILSDNHTLYFKVRLPKVNIETETVKKLNSEIYAYYQEVYSYAMTISGNEKLEIDYTYAYLNNDTILEIIINKKSILEEKETNSIIKYKYDIVNDIYYTE